MPKWMLLLFLSVLMTPAFVVAAAPQNFIEGPWQQVETTAGACPKCRIEVAQTRGSFNVTANNGWSAVVTIGGALNQIEAAGTGVWSAEKRGWVSGRPFEVVFRLIDERLHMDMRVEMPDGTRRPVEAIFERVWLGA